MQPPTGTTDAAVTRQMPPVPNDTNTLPPAPSIVSAPGEACPKCGSMVAADQRYCIDCGERIGDPRLPFMDGRTAAEPPQPAAPAYPLMPYGAPPAAPKSKWSSGLALLATVGVLLLAMGVGVLIGNDGSKGTSAAAQQPIVIGGTGATAATGASAATGGSDNSKTASAASGDGETKSGIDANAIAKKNGVKLAKPDVQLGDSCEKGAVGCDDSGKFTGDYFGN